MNLHYGPKWMWDQNRPEAIEARRQAAEFHKGLLDVRLRTQAGIELRAIVENLLAIRFRIAAWHLVRFVKVVRYRSKNWATPVDF